MTAQLNRRKFLKTGLVAGAALSGSRVTFFIDRAQAAGQSDEMLAAHLIWCAESAPVDLRREGRAVGIASSADGKLPEATPDLHTVFVKEFSLEALPSKAEIRLFAHTRYRLYVNGVYQGRGPSRYQIQHPEYDTRDILAALHPGVNRVAVLVHRDAPTGRIMRHEPGFAAAVRLVHAGKAHDFMTDATWLARPDRSFRPREEAWASIQENIDARLGEGWSSPEYQFTGWAPAVLVKNTETAPIWPRTTPLQGETAVPWSASAPTTPVDLAAGKEMIFGLTQIVQGYHLLDFEAEPGSELEVSYLLPEGTNNGVSTYITRAGRQLWMGGDTFACNKISVKLKSGQVKLLRAQAIEVRYPFERVASFHSSDPYLNQLWTICARSLEVLSEDSYVDCADRERVEWTDDSPPAFDCTRVMMRGPDSGGKTYWGDNRLLKSLLRRIALSQQSDGQLKAHSCSERFDIHAIMEDRSCDWVVLLREYLESSGDLELVRELWPTLTRLLKWFLDRRTHRGLVLAREWEVWDNPLRYQVCEGAGLNAFVYRALVDAAYLGKAIGRIAEGKAYAGAAAELQRSFNELLWNHTEGSYDGALFGPDSKRAEQLNGKLFDGPITGTWTDGRYQPTSQAALFALYGGIVPAERVAPVRTWLLAHLDGVKGPMSHYYLFRALYEMEDPQHDSLVLARMRTGWKAQVDSPWQSCWEDLPDEGGSKIHMYGLVPGCYLTTHVLGVRRVGPIGDRAIRIEPRCGGLDAAEGIAVTEFGPVPVKWTKSGDGAMRVECETPAGTTTQLRFYRVKESRFVRVDGLRREATVEGAFLRIELAAGKHVVESA